MLSLPFALFLASNVVVSDTGTQEKVPAPPPAGIDVKTLPPAPSAPTVLPERATPVLAPPATPRAKLATAPASIAARANDLDASMDRVLVDDGAPDGAWMLGRGWKARVDGSGACFVPRFGGGAPSSVAFALASVVQGGVDVPFERSGVVARSGDALVVDRGAFVETWTAGLDGLEQSFVLDRPLGEGELVLRVASDTGLDAAQHGDGIAFAGEHGRVEVSAAEAFDARGARTSVATRLVDGAIEMRVDAAFLASATWPVVIDPLVTFITVESDPATAIYADCAYDPVNDRWLVVWEREFTPTDHDVWAQEYDANGVAIAGSLASIDFTGTDWSAGKVAYNRLAQQYLVAVHAGPSGSRAIWGRTRAAGSTTMGAQFRISDPAVTGDTLFPDVGGDPATVGPTYFFVAWTRVFSAPDNDVHARLVAPDGSLVGSTIFLDNTGSTLDRNVSVSKSDGMPPFAEQRWNVAWDRQIAFDDHDVWAAQVRWDGAVMSPAFAAFTGPTNLQIPSASSLRDPGQGPRCWCIACTQLDTTQHDIYVLTMEDGSYRDLSFLSSMELGGAFEPQDQIYPSIDTDGTRFVVAYQETYGGPGPIDYDVYASTFVLADTQVALTEEHANLAFSTDSEHEPQLALRHASGGADRRGMVVWWRNGSQTGIRAFEAALYDAALGGAVIQACGSGVGVIQCPCAQGAPFHGCPNSLFPGGALLDVTGAASVSQDSFTLLGSSMPNSIALYFQGDALLGPIVVDDGLGCVGGTVVRLGTKANASNASRYPDVGDPSISVRGLLPALGGSRWYQCFYRNAASFCTPATSNRTNGIRVVWAP